MKRLLLLLLSIVIWPLSAVIVSGYKYQCGDTTVYFLGDSHIDEYLEKKTIKDVQCNELKKIFTQLYRNGQSVFFVEYDLTDRDENEPKTVLGEMNTFLKNNQDITFKNEDGLKKQFINTHTVLLGGLLVSGVRHSMVEDQLEESLNSLVLHFKNEKPYSKFSSLGFMSELETLEKEAGVSFSEKKLLSETMKNKNDIYLFRTLVFRPAFIKALEALYNRYREKLMSNFVEQSIKERKKTIVVMAGANHIDALRKKINENVKILKEFKSENQSNKPSQVQVLKASTLQELFLEPTFWERLKHQAYEWRKILIPAAVTGLSVGYWWLKSRSKSATPNLTHK